MQRSVLVYQDGVPCFMSVHRSALWFDTKEQALAYYEGPEYDLDFRVACSERADQLREVSHYLDTLAAKQMPEVK
jgi:hypothetical protein